MRWHAFLVIIALLLMPGVGSVRANESGVAGEDVFALLDRTLPVEQRCDVRFLMHLGWRFVRDPAVQQVTIDGGWPCRHATLKAAQAAGALRILVPAQFGLQYSPALGAMAADIADTAPARAAYQHRIATATRKATTRLDELTKRERLTFPHIFGLGIVHSPNFRIRVPQSDWEISGNGAVARQSSAKALASIYQRGAIVDCYVGQTLALYSTQYELHGAKRFDALFPPKEMTFGPPRIWLQSPLGKHRQVGTTLPWYGLLLREEEMRVDHGLALAQHGSTAFVGLAGAVCNQDAQEETNDNFVIVSVSDRALAELVQGGGLAHYTARANRIWAATYGARSEGAAPCNVDAVLASPAFSEVRIYVHPYGVIPIADIFRKWLDRTKSPVQVRLYLRGFEDFLYKRYRAAYKRDCKRVIEAAVQAVPSVPR